MATEEQKRKRSLYSRKMVKKCDRTHGNKRQHKSLEDRLRKYEVRGEGYEFVPAMMHLIERYLTQLPEDSKNAMDERLARSLDKIPEARKVLEVAAEKHRGIPRAIKRRAFSPKYLDIGITQGIDIPEIVGIVQRARALRNTSVRSIAAAVATTGRLPVKETHDCCCCCCQGTPPSQPDPTPTAPPNQYEVTFTKLYCVDESNPEDLGIFGNISDEPYVVFGVITEEMAEAGTPALASHTPVYEDVDDGDTRPQSGDENLRLFGFAGPRAIDSSVLITASCFENDLGDVSETTDAVRAALTTAATTAAGAGGLAGWLVAGVAVVGIGVTYLIDLIGADDQINDTIALSLTEADADARTSAVNPIIFDPLHFDGGDSDGIYDVYLKLRRV
ncbi:MAG: hypothetical protein Q8Q07_08685 [Dehalococcoidales bacterium]|nr:hypothetical protein [Dehalococcoidales bacterium]